MLGPSQWEAPLLCDDVSHWLGANLESVLQYVPASVVDIKLGAVTSQTMLYTSLQRLTQNMDKSLNLQKTTLMSS